MIRRNTVISPPTVEINLKMRFVHLSTGRSDGLSCALWRARGKEDTSQSKSPPVNTCHLPRLTGMDLLQTGLRSDGGGAKNAFISLIFFFTRHVFENADVEFTTPPVND